MAITITLPYDTAASIAKRLKQVTPGRMIVPVLACALVDADAGKVTATDLEAWATLDLPAGSVIGEGRALVRTHDLYRLVNAAKPSGSKARREAVAVVMLDGSTLSVTVGQHTLTDTDQPTEVDDYPALPSFDDLTPWATLDAADFAATLRFVGPAVGRDDTLPALTGVHITPGPDGLAIAGTNRYQLATAECPAVVVGERPILLPRDSASLLAGMSGKVALSIAGAWANTLHVTGDGETLWLRLLEGSFPNVAPIVESARHDADPWIVQTGPVASAAKVIAAASSKYDTTPVAFDRDSVTVGTVTIPAASDVVPARDALLNPKYLATSIAAFESDTLTIYASAAHRPVLFSGSLHGREALHLIMPIRKPS